MAALSGCGMLRLSGGLVVVLNFCSWDCGAMEGVREEKNQSCSLTCFDLRLSPVSGTEGLIKRGGGYMVPCCRFPFLLSQSARVLFIRLHLSRPAAPRYTCPVPWVIESHRLCTLH